MIAKTEGRDIMRQALERRWVELERLRLQLLSALEDLDDELLNRRPDDHHWSVAQILSHLVTAERLSLVSIRRRLDGTRRAGWSGPLGAARSLLLSLALHSPLKFKAPPRAADLPERAALDEIHRNWENVRREMQELLDEIPPALAGKALFRHPVAGMMNLDQALKFHTDHLRRHAGQIDRVLRRVS